MESQAGLISTLGTEPQVVGLALLALQRLGERVKRAVVVHSQAEWAQISRAVQKLRESWPGLPYTHGVELECVALPVRDIDSESTVRMAYQGIRDVVSDLKEEGFRLHVNISGGRKPLVLCALLAAQFFFGPEDRLWYLVSSPELIRSRRFIPKEGDHFELIPLPVPLWTDTAALFATLARYDDPWALAQIQKELRHREEAQRFEHFVQHILSPAERAAVLALIDQGGTAKDLARRLGKRPKTVANQLEAAGKKLRTFMGWPNTMPIQRTTLLAILAPYAREIAPKDLGEAPVAQPQEKEARSKRR